MGRWLPLVMLMGAASCTDAAPCSGSLCPPLEGIYVMQYEAPELGGCVAPALADPPNTLQIFRQGSIANTVIIGIEASGQIYDTYDFSMSGLGPSLDGGTASVAMRGYYVPPAHPDGGSGGAVIKGTLTLGIGQCSADRKYTGGQL